MNLHIQLPSPVQDITGSFMFDDSMEQNMDQSSIFDKSMCANISVVVKRDDLLHPIISGNKWRKLSGSLSTIAKHNCTHIISFGGAYSNHLHALSYACAALNLRFTAVIRGDYSRHLTPTLTDLQQWGAQLHFVSKLEYKNRSNAQYCESLMHMLDADYVIPEGGSHSECLRGVSAIITEIAAQAPDITHMVLPVASAGTLAGVLSSKALPNIKIVGIGVLKGKGYLENLVENLLGPAAVKQVNKQWEIQHDFHHGGYAKTSNELNQFITKVNAGFATQTMHAPIAIEPIYSGKCFYALKSLMSTGYFPANSNILILHTGGLQGARSM